MTDVNGDTTLDIVVTLYGSNSIGVLLNNGNCIFFSETTYPTDVYPTALAAADVNSDNKPDIILINQVHPLSVFFSVQKMAPFFLKLLI